MCAHISLSAQLKIISETNSSPKKVNEFTCRFMQHYFFSLTSINLQSFGMLLTDTIMCLEIASLVRKYVLNFFALK